MPVLFISILIMADWPLHYSIQNFIYFFLSPPKISMTLHAFPLSHKMDATSWDSNSRHHCERKYISTLINAFTFPRPALTPTGKQLYGKWDFISRGLLIFPISLKPGYSYSMYGNLCSMFSPSLSAFSPFIINQMICWSHVVPVTFNRDSFNSHK